MWDINGIEYLCKGEGMKKRKTLPKDFEEIVECGDIEEIKKAIDACEIDAYTGFDKKTALMFTDLPEEIIRYLVENGADINQATIYGDTALSKHAFVNSDKIPLLIELGADINYHEENRDTALYKLAGHHRVDGIRTLIENGADIYIKCGRNNINVLEYSLHLCRNIDIVNMYDIAIIFLDKGMEITDDMRKQVTRIGEDFEFIREDFNVDYLEETDIALQNLYKLFDVRPIPRRVIYDGTSPIVVKEKTWQKQHEELWNLLVPGSGHASTIQGEVIRIVGKVSYEILDNGGINWDKDYRTMCKALVGYLSQGTPVDGEAIDISKSISLDMPEENLNKLAKYAVEWVIANPMPIKLESVEYKR